MFSFHKPKIYRSLNGCCICKAKSSSSRFTDSKKYEPEFERCFRIAEKRSGEICNACVLLVKRWKKLPAGTNRDWRHVVDARAGPGTKSINKGKCKSNTKKPLKKHRNKIYRDKQERCISGDLSDDVTVGDDSMSESSNFSLPHSRIPSPVPSDTSEDSGLEEVDDDDIEDVDDRPKRKREDAICHGMPSKRHKATPSMSIASFLDMTFWRKEKICCGVIFKGLNNEVLIYPKLLRPCMCRRRSSAAFSTLTEATLLASVDRRGSLEMEDGECIN